MFQFTFLTVSLIFFPFVNPFDKVGRFRGLK